MRTANIAEVKNHFSHFVALAEEGETIQLCRRNVPVARLVPMVPGHRKNRTVLGCGAGTVQIRGDLTEPAIAADEWDMLTQ